MSQQPSNAENLSHNPPKIEKPTKQIDVSWIREGIKSTRDIEKINKIFENWDKLSFQERMLVFDSLISQYKLIEQKIKKESNEKDFSINFINHLKKSKVDLAVLQSLYKILGKYYGEIDGEDLSKLKPIDEEDMETIGLFVFYMKNKQAEKLNLPKPYNLIPNFEDERSEGIFYIYLSPYYEKLSILTQLTWNLLPQEFVDNVFNPETLCSNKPYKETPDSPPKYEYCLDYKLSPEELDEFYHYTFQIADSIDNLFKITENKKNFKWLFLE